MTVALRPADADDLDYLEELLSANDLPTDDLRESPAEFYVATREDRRVGAGGLDVRGDHALLRSLAVESAERGQGVGTAICEKLASRARRTGVESLFLLTTTAAEFFAARGFERAERDAVPAAIAETSEFATLCPDAATCMRRSL